MAEAGPMTGRVCLITGGTGGLGKETALALARLGASVSIVARDAAKGQAVVEEIQAQTGNPQVEALRADLSSQASIRSLADEFKRRHERLHVLVNNAGGVFNPRRVTVDGLEMTFALNHLAYFLLTALLLDTLKASAPARVVSVSSEAQSNGRINFDDLQGEKRYSAMTAYSQSKLANILFTVELARQLAGTGVTANVVHPGAVRTNFGKSATGLFRWVVRLAGPFMLTPARGAETIVYLASSPEVEGMTGQYFANKKARPLPAAASDTALVRRLWDVSAALVHLDGQP